MFERLVVIQIEKIPRVFFKSTNFILTVIVFIGTAILSATSVSADSYAKRTECLDCLITGFYKDTKHILTSPFHWSKQNLITFAVLSVGTSGLMLADEDLQDLVQDHRNSTTNRISNWTNRNTRRVKNLTIGGFYLSGVIFNNKKAKETAFLCLESVILAEGITTAIKHVVGRTRPCGNKGAFNFDPLEYPPPPASLSFPSGHTTTAFALSSVIAEQYRSTPLAIALYGWATVVSLARVNSNVHFMSDVFWGGVIGIYVGKAIVKFSKPGASKNYRIHFIDKPDYTGIGVGISII
ncbi:MAG: phosphatase PAP2 family protein [candidate division Zixibacteria bacterium]|nr:phosphatase PAP2 family protein [candidate division Zixibacteria bacterium]